MFPCERFFGMNGSGVADPFLAPPPSTPYTSSASTPTTVNFESFGVLLVSPPQSGKSSMLFQLAVTHALRGEYVVYVCNRTRLYSSPPCLAVPLSTVTEAALTRIIFKYIDTHTALRQFLVGISPADCGGSYPTVIIVDDF
eukprot:PhF_6_TR42867/c0_g1_i4/m.64937